MITTATVEAQVRDFAAQYPTENVLRMVALCESGRITWSQAHEIARKALAAGLSTVVQ